MLASAVVCSDETSVRVQGKNWWEWVFIGTLAVLHVIKPSRGKAVVQALFSDINHWFGCPTCCIASAATQSNGRCAWRTCSAQRTMPLTAVIPPSAFGSSGCCYVRLPSGDDEIV